VGVGQHHRIQGPRFKGEGLVLLKSLLPAALEQAALQENLPALEPEQELPQNLISIGPHAQ
jgi:hypothetical protein